MGDYFQSIVDGEATESESSRLGDLICDWLIDEGIISALASDCVLGSDSGYPPGPNHKKVTYEYDEHFLALLTNGLSIITKRYVYHSGQGGTKLVCRACGARQKPNDEWSHAIDEWYKGNGKGLLACSHCGNVEAINHWKHNPNWGFGNLGFTFWNWPPLTDEFVKQFGENLGHRIIFVSGKL